MKESKTQKVSKFDKFNPIGIWHLISVVAEAMGAYVLYFSGQTQSLKVVAGILLIDAAVKATKYFVIK